MLGPQTFILSRLVGFAHSGFPGGRDAGVYPRPIVSGKAVQMGIIFRMHEPSGLG